MGRNKNNNRNVLISANVIGNKFEALFKQRIIGQDYACLKIKNALFKSNTNTVPKEKPDVITFVGPTAVGKSEAASVFAQAISRKKYIIDGNAYTTINDILDGVDGSYKNDTPSPITMIVTKDRTAVIEIQNFQNMFSKNKNIIQEMLSTGFFYDKNLKQFVDVRNCIFIITLNDEQDLYNDTNKINYATLTDTKILQSLANQYDKTSKTKIFSQSIISTFASGTIIPFNRLTPLSLCKIAKSKSSQFKKRLFQAFGGKVVLNEEFLSRVLLFNKGSNADARNISSTITQFLNENLSNIVELFLEQNKDIKNLKSIKYNFDFSEEVKKYLNNKDKNTVAVYCSEEEKEYFINNSSMDVKFITEESIVSSLEFDLVLASVSKKMNNCISVIRTIQERDVDIPIYAFSIMEPKSKTEKNILTKEGVVELYDKDIDNFNLWLKSIMEEASLIKSFEKLTKRRKVVDFDIHYELIDNSKEITAKVLLDSFRLEDALSTEEESKLVSKIEMSSVSFSDIIGLDETIKEINSFLKVFDNPIQSIREGKALPKGFLLHGFPGCGKTLLAKAIANELGIPFIAVCSSDFNCKYVGEGEDKLKGVIRLAKRLGGILFFDEFETIAKKRGGDSVMAEINNALQNILLTEMDGLKTNSKNRMFVIAASNFSPQEHFDAALMRRFDRIIEIKLPKTKARIDILKFYLNKHNLKLDEEEIVLLADRTIGRSPDDLAKLVKLVRNKGNEPTIKDFFEELERMLYGEKNETVTLESINKTTYHEVGHVLVYYKTSGKVPNYVTNIARGNHCGYMIANYDEKSVDYTYNQLKNEICVALAGRVAEKIFFGIDGVTTGAKSDLQRAKDIVKKMINEYSMLDDFIGGVGQSEQSKQLYDKKINEILQEELQRAEKIILENKNVLEKLAKLLLQENGLDKKELDTFFNGL